MEIETVIKWERGKEIKWKGKTERQWAKRLKHRGTGRQRGWELEKETKRHWYQQTKRQKRDK